MDALVCCIVMSFTQNSFCTFLEAIIFHKMLKIVFIVLEIELIVTRFYRNNCIFGIKFLESAGNETNWKFSGNLINYII